MSNTNHGRCSNHEVHTRVETLTLDDGRRAERHVTVQDNGQEVVEIFAEEKRPLKLEKRIVREMKSVVAKETHETIHDGEITFQEVLSVEPEVPLQVRTRIGLADHAKIVDGDYVRKEEIGSLIADGVVAGVSALMEQYEPVTTAQTFSSKGRAQQIVENNVEEKKKSDMVVNVIMGVIIVAQLAFFGYMFMM